MEIVSVSSSSPPFFLHHSYSPLPTKTHHQQLRNLHSPLHLKFAIFDSSTTSPYLQFQAPHTQKRKTLPTKSRHPFKEEDAYPNSLPLQEKNPAAVLKYVKELARQDDLQGALAIFDYLDQRGIPVNATTYSSLIAACIRSRSLSLAKRIDAHIRKSGLEGNEFLRTKLVQMYASCGSADDAKRLLFDGGNSHGGDSVYPWNALLRGSVVSGWRTYADVLLAYSRMRELGVELNEYSFSCLIKSFAGAVEFRQGLKAHGLLIKNGWIGSRVLRTCLIDMYSKCRKIKLAFEVFEEIPERDVVVWGAMIAGFAHNRMRREVLKYVRLMSQQGVELNSALVAMILPVIGELGALQLGKEVHAYAVKTKSYAEHLFVQSALIDMYCKCRDMDMGRKVFSSSKERSTVSWTALMSGYRANGRLEQALKSIIWMQQEGFRPDVVTIATVLPVCGKLRTLNHGKEMHGYAVRNDLFPNVSLTNSLIVMYSKCGTLEYSRRLFEGLDRRNVISWTVMIDSLTDNGCLHEALDVFRTMQLSKHQPDSVTISRVLGICGELRTLSLGKEIHGQVLKKDIELVPFVSAGIMKMYGKCGVFDKASLVFDLIPNQGLVTQTALIEIYGYNGRFREAIAFFDQMVSEGCTPSRFTFSVALSICNQAGFVDDACRIFKSMTQVFGIEPDEEHHGIMNQLLIRLGRVDEADKVYNRGGRKAFAVSRRNSLATIFSICTLSKIAMQNPTFAQPSVGFREYIDTFDGYSLKYPQNWIQVKGAGADIFFRDPFVLDENLSVDISSPSSSKYKSVEDLGPPEIAGKKMLKQYLTEFMSTRLGVRRESSIISASADVADDGRVYYQVEVNIKSYANNNELAILPQDRVARLEWDRRYLSVLGVENNRLYELRLQTPERVFKEQEGDLRQVMNSFRVNKVTG